MYEFYNNIIPGRNFCLLKLVWIQTSDIEIAYQMKADPIFL